MNSSDTAGRSRSKRSRWLLRVVSLLVAGSTVAVPAASAGAAPAPTPAPSTRPPVVLVYGDSIVLAAAPSLQTLLAREGITVVNASVGATAPCDALQFVQSDMVKYDPSLVVIAYVGNSFSPCINGTHGLDVYIRHYVDTQRLVEAVGHRPVVIDTPPGDIGQGHYTAYEVMVAIEASTLGLHLADTARALIDPATHRFEKSMPCPTTTVCTRVDVRGDDDYHLTPAGGYLYAQALARSVLKWLHIPRSDKRAT
jgi:hypothetical protein